MTVGYSLNNPEFVKSYMKSQEAQYFGYQIFGMVIVALFILNYVVKFMFTIPQSKNNSGLIPHVFALKACCLVMYPAYFEHVNFCKGFMVVDFPWANSILADILANNSDYVEIPFGLFF